MGNGFKLSNRKHEFNHTVNRVLDGGKRELLRIIIEEPETLWMEMGHGWTLCHEIEYIRPDTLGRVLLPEQWFMLIHADGNVTPALVAANHGNSDTVLEMFKYPRLLREPDWTGKTVLDAIEGRCAEGLNGGGSAELDRRVESAVRAMAGKRLARWDSAAAVR